MHASASKTARNGQFVLWHRLQSAKCMQAMRASGESALQVMAAGHLQTPASAQRIVHIRSTKEDTLVHSMSGTKQRGACLEGARKVLQGLPMLRLRVPLASGRHTRRQLFCLVLMQLDLQARGLCSTAEPYGKQKWALVELRWLAD